MGRARAKWGQKGMGEEQGMAQAALCSLMLQAGCGSHVPADALGCMRGGGAGKPQVLWGGHKSCWVPLDWAMPTTGPPGTAEGAEANAAAAPACSAQSLPAGKGRAGEAPWRSTGTLQHVEMLSEKSVQRWGGSACGAGMMAFSWCG